MALRKVVSLAFLTLSATVLTVAGQNSSAGGQHVLLRSPSLSQDRIAFRYADDIWTVSRNGGKALRLTSNGHVVAGPFYSPDGAEIAFTAHLRGNDDAYIVSTNGGVPRRITFHPAGSRVAGWTRDGKNLLIASGMASYRHFDRLFLVHSDGSGMPEPLPLPMGVEGSFSPDGQSLAYQPITKWEEAWKRYVGGQTTPIWIVNLKTLELVRVPRNNSNDSSPVWQGDAVYFLSDRGSQGPGPVSLYKYDVNSKHVSPVGVHQGFDVKSVQGGPGGLVYEQFGSIHFVNTETNDDRIVPIEIQGELPELSPHIATIVPEEIQNAALSPSGVRAAFEAHGEIFTVPGEKGDTRNLTRTSDAAERDPSWSPDGKTIAYFSDASGEYKLYLQEQTGIKPPTVIDLGPDPSYFYGLRWSPDSKHIAYIDKHNRSWLVDVPTDPKAPAPKPIPVDKGLYGNFGPDWSAVWSPDSKWIAYHRDLPNQLRAVFLYSLETHKSTQVTDGMSDATSPAFDPNGKYLYFIESTNDGPSQAGIDLSSLDRAQTSAPYVVVLAKDGASPVPPESDDEKLKEEKKPEPPKVEADAKDDTSGKSKSGAKTEDKAENKDKEKKDTPAETKIDLEGLRNRILSLPIPPRNYNSILTGKTGVIYLLEGPPVGRSSNEGPGPNFVAVWRFTLEKRQPEATLNNVDSFSVSSDRSKVLYNRKAAWTIAPIDDLKPGNDNPGKPLNMSQMQAAVDPRAEWRQMYHETWRIQRDFLYDPNIHGLSIPKIEARYKPYLDNLASRSEFSYLSTEMLGEITIGHMFVGGPDPHEKEPKCGLLGADFTFDHDRYRIAKILGGQNWTPGLASPLTLPGVYVKEGEYLLAVNGRELHATDSLYAALDGTADKQTVIHVGPNPDGKDARDVTVVPVASEDGLRNIDWVEGNRHKVDELSGGKVAYVYMPNTGGAGYSNFNRYFYSQLDKKALVVDERWNEGGYIADYVVDVLKRFPLSGAVERDGKPIYDPVGAIFGPKVMLINQGSGSGGDANPWYFRKAAIGKIVGTRTWGGLVGIGGYPTLMDGGAVTAPRYGIFGLNGDWEVENRGIPPDVEVELLPKDFADGHDRQLEEGVRIVLEELKANPVPELKVPPYPNYHKNDGLGRE